MVRGWHGVHLAMAGHGLSPQLSKVGIRTMHSALCSSQRSFIIDTQIQLDLLPSSRTVQGRQTPSTMSDRRPFGKQPLNLPHVLGTVWEVPHPKLPGAPWQTPYAIG